MVKTSPTKLCQKGVKTSPTKPNGACAAAASRDVVKTAHQTFSIAESQALAWISNFFKENLPQVLYCKSACENGQFDRDVKTHDLEQADVFHSTYTMFKSLPKYFPGKLQGAALWDVQRVGGHS